MYIYIYIYMYIFNYIYIRIHIHMHIHIYIYIYIYILSSYSSIFLNIYFFTYVHMLSQYFPSLKSREENKLSRCPFKASPDLEKELPCQTFQGFSYENVSCVVKTSHI
jgi:hypothetical protein